MDTSEDHREGLYPIRAVAARTGVNPVTLRAWERRYGLVKPQRTAKGHRLYSEADIQRIEQIMGLLDQGVAISRVRSLLDQPQASTPPPAPEVGEGAADALTGYRQRMHAAIERFDDRALLAAYNDALSLYPVDMVARDLILPMNREVAEAARRGPGSVAEAQWRFLNAFLRNKIGARFHQQITQKAGRRLVTACLPGESSEIELLLFCLSAMTYGFRVLLLGSDVSLELIAPTVERSGASGVVLFGDAHSVDPSTDGALDTLADDLPVPVFVGGSYAERRGHALSAGGSQPLPEDWHAAVDRIRRGLGAGEPG